MQLGICRKILIDGSDSETGCLFRPDPFLRQQRLAYYGAFAKQLSCQAFRDYHLFWSFQAIDVTIEDCEAKDFRQRRVASRYNLFKTETFAILFYRQISAPMPKLGVTKVPASI